MPPVESAASRANQLVRKAGDHPSLPFKSTPQCSTLVGTQRLTTIAECALLRRRRGDPTQGKRVVLTMPEVPRSPRGVLVNSTLDAADTGPDRAIIMFVASPTLSKCPVWRSEWVCGTQPSGNFPTVANGFPTEAEFCYS